MKREKEMNSIYPPITVPLEPLTFPLRQAAKEYPKKVAVITPEAGGKEYSYQWLEENSSALAASLAGMGVEPQDRIALWMKNSLEYILSFYGILKAGGVVVPISTHYGEREVLHQLKETEVKGMITSDNLYAQVENLMTEVQGLRFVVLEGQGETRLGHHPLFIAPCGIASTGPLHRDRSQREDRRASFLEWYNRPSEGGHADPL